MDSKVLLVSREVPFYVAMDAYERCYGSKPERSAIYGQRAAYGMEADHGELSDLTGGVAVEIPPEWMRQHVSGDNFDMLVGYLLTSGEPAADEARILFAEEGYSLYKESELQRFARAVTPNQVDVSRWFGGQSGEHAGSLSQRGHHGGCSGRRG